MVHFPEGTPPEQPSKTRRKRDMHRLQELGESLVGLDAAALARMPIGEELRSAVEEAGRISARGALKRQLQYIGKLMRSENGEAVAEALERLRAGSLEEKQRLHLLEQWRERLIEEGEAAVDELLAEWPDADRQHLRQLIRGARQEQERDKPPAAGRKLYRYLREVMRPS